MDSVSRPRRADRRWIAALPTILMVCSSCRPCVHPPGTGSEFVTAPPAVQSLAVQLLEVNSGTGYLLVSYAPDPRLGPQLTLAPFGEPVVFHDDGEAGDARAGDGTYTGAVQLDVKALRARWREVAEIMGVPLPAGPAAMKTRGFDFRQPRFDGREIEAVVTVEPIQVGALEENLLTGKRVSLDEFNTCTQLIDPDASLFIKHRDVMGDPKRTYLPCGPSGPQGDPNGKWAFGYLMRQLAGGSSVSDADVSKFIKKWLEQWKKTPGVNGFPLPARPLLDSLIITPWKAASASAGLEFDPAKAPFRLLAIVNRIDKSDSLIYGSGGAPQPGDAGEVRFVFGALSSECQPLHFTVIFEYTVDKGDCAGIAQWATDWIALSKQRLGTDSYRAELQKLTDQVVKPSVLGQLRTNEISLDASHPGSVWDLREFHLAGGQLAHDMVAQTPQDTLNGTTALRDYLNANGAIIVKEQYDVPALYPSSAHFRGDDAIGNPSLTFWNTAGIVPAPVPGGTPAPATEVRHKFSRNTCNGCHNADTGSNGMHVNPMLDSDAVGQPSTFLTGAGGPVPDPTDSTLQYTFNDLERRRQDLSQAASFPCLCQFFRQRIAAPH